MCGTLPSPGLRKSIYIDEDWKGKCLVGIKAVFANKLVAVVTVMYAWACV